ncbi:MULTISPECIES: hypothetical protein [unclassified Vibrio]|uniref:hypothetical protein n=1 Tax=unclassified Vibrio TaxID=2614977 RepID=UPI001882CFBE|nr:MULTISPECIES: hypothetical protein [unclassified Vibrio]MBE8573532.1 hypothetical protein [Vibrio sp. OPT46]MBE8580673.1 hypothetical protein [Vibrio sp. OPT41]
MDVEFWKLIGNGFIELVKVSGPYFVAVLGAIFGYLGNKNAKEISIKVAELQSDKDLSLQRETHRFEDGKRVAEIKKDIIDRVVKELEPIYSNTLSLIKAYYSMCSSGDSFNKKLFDQMIRDRFFADVKLQVEADSALARVSAYVSILADANMSMELIKLQTAFQNVQVLLNRTILIGAISILKK